MNIDKALKALKKHIEDCETGHYGAGIQAIDLIIAMDILDEFAMASIIKYASRYSNTFHDEDLLKIAHYALMVYKESKE